MRQGVTEWQRKAAAATVYGAGRDCTRRRQPPLPSPAALPRLARAHPVLKGPHRPSVHSVRGRHGPHAQLAIRRRVRGLSKGCCAC